MLQIRRLAERDHRALHRLVVESLCADPLGRFLYPGAPARRLAAALAANRFLRTHVASARAWVAECDGWLLGAALWIPAREGRERSLVRALLGRSGASLPFTHAVRSLGPAYASTLDRLGPREGWGLSLLRARPDLRGRDIGDALLAPALASFDAAQERASASTTDARLVPFFERHGFTIERTSRPTPRGPACVALTRLPFTPEARNPRRLASAVRAVPIAARPLPGRLPVAVRVAVRSIGA